jgi:hypothetical protein
MPNSKPKFVDQDRMKAALFYGAIIDWTTQMGRNLDFWIALNAEQPTMFLRAIRAVWGKEKCQMDVQYDHEKTCEETYYIPITLFIFKNNFLS